MNLVEQLDRLACLEEETRMARHQLEKTVHQALQRAPDLLEAHSALTAKLAELTEEAARLEEGIRREALARPETGIIARGQWYMVMVSERRTVSVPDVERLAVRHPELLDTIRVTRYAQIRALGRNNHE